MRLPKWIRRRRYLRPDSLNELVDLMADLRGPLDITPAIQDIMPDQVTFGMGSREYYLEYEAPHPEAKGVRMSEHIGSVDRNAGLETVIQGREENSMRGLLLAAMRRDELRRRIPGCQVRLLNSRGAEITDQKLEELQADARRRDVSLFNI